MNSVRAIALAMAGAVSFVGKEVAAGRQQVPTFRAEVTAVTVDVSVTLGRRPLSGLASEDFLLQDNGVGQQIEALSAGSQPLDLTVMWDVSGSVSGLMMVGNTQTFREVMRSLQPTDQVRVLTVNNHVSRLFDFVGPGSVPSLPPLSGRGATPLYDGLVASLIRGRSVGRRSVIVALTDARDNLSWFGHDVIEMIAKRSDSVLFILVARDLDEVSGIDRLRAVADATGGTLLETNAGSSPAAVAKVLEQFRAGYVLYYRPTNVSQFGWHELRVSVRSHPQASVRARQGYWASAQPR